MSLPAGVLNRQMVTTHPRVLGRVLRLTFVSLLVLSPLFVYIVAQIQGIKSRYECSQIEQKIIEARLERRQLLAQRAQLVAPERLQQEAERLGLVRSSLAERPGAPVRPWTPPEVADGDGAQPTVIRVAGIAPRALPAADEIAAVRTAPDTAPVPKKAVPAAPAKGDAKASTVAAASGTKPPVTASANGKTGPTEKTAVGPAKSPRKASAHGARKSRKVTRTAAARDGGPR